MPAGVHFFTQQHQRASFTIAGRWSGDSAASAAERAWEYGLLPHLLDADAIVHLKRVLGVERVAHRLLDGTEAALAAAAVGHAVCSVKAILQQPEPCVRTQWTACQGGACGHE